MILMLRSKILRIICNANFDWHSHFDLVSRRKQSSFNSTPKIPFRFAKWSFGEHCQPLGISYQIEYRENHALQISFSNCSTTWRLKYWGFADFASARFGSWEIAFSSPRPVWPNYYCSIKSWKFWFNEQWRWVCQIWSSFDLKNQTTIAKLISNGK